MHNVACACWSCSDSTPPRIACSTSWLDIEFISSRPLLNLIPCHHRCVWCATLLEQKAVDATVFWYSVWCLIFLHVHLEHSHFLVRSENAIPTSTATSLLSPPSPSFFGSDTFTLDFSISSCLFWVGQGRDGNVNHHPFTRRPVQSGPPQPHGCQLWSIAAVRDATTTAIRVTPPFERFHHPFEYRFAVSRTRTRSPK